MKEFEEERRQRRSFHFVATEWVYKILKYVIAGIILVLLLKYIPDNNVSILDIVTILVVIVAAQFILDFICDAKTRYNQNCVCEPMDNVKNSDDKKDDDKKRDDKSKINYSCDKNLDDNLDNDIDDNFMVSKRQNSIQNDNIENDLGYDNTGYDKYIPMGSIRDPNRLSFRKRRDTRGEYGDWFIPPEEWYPPCIKPPICVTNNGCPVQPVLTNGNYADMRDFDNSRKITQESINVPYVLKRNSITSPQTNKAARNNVKKWQTTLRRKEESN